jgi:serine phosphatase RsbU (regulator of sigma subunit)
MRINPLYRVAISLVLATLGILAASGFINYRMTKTYDQLSLEFFNKQLQKPIDAEVLDQIQLYEPKLKAASYDVAQSANFRKASSNYLDAENAPPEDYDPEPALWDLRIETRKLMDTAILSTDKNLNVRGISYILKKKKNVTFSEWRETSEKHDQFPDEIIKKIVERKKAHKFLMPVYYWIDNGMPTATSVVPIGRFDYSGYLLVHASLLDVLSALDKKLGAEIQFLSAKDKKVIYTLPNIKITKDAKITEFLSPLKSDSKKTYGLMINDKVTNQLASIKVTADITELDKKLASVRIESFVLFAVVVVLIAFIADGLVIVLFRRVFLKQVAAEEEIQKSIRYAGRIQRTLLPKFEPQIIEMDVVWQPRDIVGGDLYMIHESDEKLIIVLIDCTGHGVPGGFLSAVAHSVVDRVITDNNHKDAGDYLSEINTLFKELLNQKDKKNATSNEGLDGGIFVFDKTLNMATFSGAATSLFLTLPGQGVQEVKGDRKNVGGIRTPISYRFPTQKVEVGAFIYTMNTDGINDTMSSEKKPVAFGKKRLITQLEKNNKLEPKRTNQIVMQALNEYKGTAPFRDDITLFSFVFKDEVLNT